MGGGVFKRDVCKVLRNTLTKRAHDTTTSFSVPHKNRNEYFNYKEAHDLQNKEARKDFVKQDIVADIIKKFKETHENVKKMITTQFANSVRDFTRH